MNANPITSISERIKTQDNRATMHPMFCVQEKKRIVGMDADYSDEYWETVMVALTQNGCEEYLKLNGHNHSGETRIYVKSFNRCPEMIAVRQFLMALPANANI